MAANLTMGITKTINIKNDIMISVAEAKTIAMDHCDGDILNISTDTIILPHEKEPLSWLFTIHHEDYDGNVSKTVIEINKFGVVLDWYKILISEK